jgi:hypothetical protein
MKKCWGHICAAIAQSRWGAWCLAVLINGLAVAGVWFFAADSYLDLFSTIGPWASLTVGPLALRLAFAGLVLWAAYWLYARRWRAYQSASAQRWWDIADKAGHPSWEDIRKLVMGEGSGEPLAFERTKPTPLRACGVWPFAMLVASWVIISALLMFAISVVADPTVIAWFGDVSGQGEFLTKIVSSPLPIFVAGATAFFAFRQMQAGVKAKSRQEWIDKLRERMALTLALAEEYRLEANKPRMLRDKKRHADLRQRMNETRLALELQLNPSEKDHRLMMYLVQRLAKWDEYLTGPDPLDGIAEAKGLKRIALAEEPTFSTILDPGKDDGGFGATISHAMRLSHVILKREWERVKTTS